MSSYHFKIGDFRAVVIHEGFAPVDILQPGRYPNASEEELQAAIAYAEANQIPAESHMNILYLEADGQKILVDTGMGARSQSPTLGRMLSNLIEAGIAPESIDIVYLTHFHGDHINGLVGAEMQPIFPNARYLTQQSEWDAWMNPEKLAELGENAQGYLSILKPLEAKFQFLQNGDSIVAGVKVVDMPGHSLGHSGLLIESQGEKFLHMADLLHHPIQMKFPHWYIKFDADKTLAAKTRREQLAFAADSGILTLFYHLVFPALGHILREDDNFRWQPIS